MKKFLLSFGLIFVFTAYILYSRQSGSSSTQTSSIPNPIPAVPAPQPTSTGILNNIFGGESEDDAPSRPKVTSIPPKTQPVPAPKTTPSQNIAKGLYKDGTYNGSAEYAYSDYIQVSAVIQNGKLADVQYPSQTGGPSRSRYIYAYAMPQLKSEAITAQSANIDAVSGASYTSQAFQQSLVYALAQAKN